MKEFTIYQIVIFLLSGVLVLRTLYRYAKKQKTLKEVIVSILIWGGFALLAAFPFFFDLLAKVTGFKLGINALLTISTTILLIAWLKQTIINDNLENSITRVVRAQTIRDIKIEYISKLKNYEPNE